MTYCVVKHCQYFQIENYTYEIGKSAICWLGSVMNHATHNQKRMKFFVISGKNLLINNRSKIFYFFYHDVTIRTRQISNMSIIKSDFFANYWWNLMPMSDHGALHTFCIEVQSSKLSAVSGSVAWLLFRQCLRAVLFHFFVCFWPASFIFRILELFE